MRTQKKKLETCGELSFTESQSHEAMVYFGAIMSMMFFPSFKGKPNTEEWMPCVGDQLALSKHIVGFYEVEGNMPPVKAHQIHPSWGEQPHLLCRFFVTL